MSPRSHGLRQTLLCSGGVNLHERSLDMGVSMGVHGEQSQRMALVASGLMQLALWRKWLGDTGPPSQL
jgi:hypothetical protein